MSAVHDPWEDWDAEDPFEGEVQTSMAIACLCCAAFWIISGLLSGSALLFAAGALCYPWTLCWLHRSDRCET